MGRFLSGLSWSQPVASKAHALGMGLDDVQALVESRDAHVEHPRLHHYAYSRGIRRRWFVSRIGRSHRRRLHLSISNMRRGRGL